MKRLTVLFVVFIAFVFAASVLAVPQPPSSGPHFNLNVIGFSNCTMTTDGVYPDCFKGNPGPGGNVIFIPLKTSQTENICTAPDPTDNSLVTVAQLKKGVRILVTDAFGDDLQVIDKDATDGTATFNLPDGCWQVYASPGGKPGGCLDLDTIICADAVTFAPEDCDPNLLTGGQQFTLVGHINVDRSTGKPKWENVTGELLDPLTGVNNGDPGYFDFFWQIYNQNLRVLHLRFKSCD